MPPLVSDAAKPALLVTGVSGNLGTRLLPQLQGFRVIGVDMRPPADLTGLEHFEEVDLGREESCRQVLELMRRFDIHMVVHLAFVIDPVRTGVLDKARMWQINVSGTARVMEAIAVHNRMGGHVTRFLYPSSVSVYGPDFEGEATEESPLNAHTLTYAVHKKEADEVVRYRGERLTGCAVFVLRAHIFAGRTMENYLVGALRGTPTGTGSRAQKMREQNKRLPLMLPMGQHYLHKRLQFVHVDDMARLMAHIVSLPEMGEGIRVLNVAGRGEPLTIQRCAQVAKAEIIRLPGRWLCHLVLKLLWRWKISGIPPDAFPYMCGSYVMNTTRLKAFLGAKYEEIIRHTNEEALADSFVSRRSAATAQ
jgi:nucleoside-diphosphate-sugar epimerase